MGKNPKTAFAKVGNLQPEKQMFFLTKFHTKRTFFSCILIVENKYFD
jgi:hypothetical protein